MLFYYVKTVFPGNMFFLKIEKIIKHFMNYLIDLVFGMQVVLM